MLPPAARIASARRRDAATLLADIVSRSFQTVIARPRFPSRLTRNTASASPREAAIVFNASVKDATASSARSSGMS